MTANQIKAYQKWHAATFGSQEDRPVSENERRVVAEGCGGALRAAAVALTTSASAANLTGSVEKTGTSLRAVATDLWTAAAKLPHMPVGPVAAPFVCPAREVGP